MESLVEVASCNARIRRSPLSSCKKKLAVAVLVFSKSPHSSFGGCVVRRGASPSSSGIICCHTQLQFLQLNCSQLPYTSPCNTTWTIWVCRRCCIYKGEQRQQIYWEVVFYRADRKLESKSLWAEDVRICLKFGKLEFQSLWPISDLVS